MQDASISYAVHLGCEVLLGLEKSVKRANSVKLTALSG